MKKIITNLSLLALLSASSSVLANGYVGGSIGSTSADDLDLSNSFSIKGGYAITENFAIEASYISFGSDSESETTTEVIEGEFVDINLDLDLDITGLGVSAVGTLPLNDKFSLYAQAGLLSWDVGISAKASAMGFSVDADDDESGTDFIFGVGANYMPAEKIAIFAEFLSTTLSTDSGGDLDLTNISIGAKYLF